MEQLELEAILALLKYKELHIRGIAKIINAPHSNISRLMKRFLEKNVVDFRIEGKNKTLRFKKGIEALSYVYMAEHFKLLKLLEKYPNMSIIIDLILSKLDKKSELVLIFGSYAKFNAKNDSDIDIFIETNDTKIKTKVENINSKLSVKIGKFDKNSPLIKEIIKDHIMIKGIEYYYEKHNLFEQN